MTKKSDSKKGRGRPEWKPTPADRRRIAIAAGGGMPHEEIAYSFGIARATLEKHCAHELTIGASQKRMDMLNAMYTQGKKGRLAAQKAYLANLPEPAPVPLPEHEERVRQDEIQSISKQAPVAVEEGKQGPALGKKEQANLDAKTAADGTDWSDLIGPNALRQ